MKTKFYEVINSRNISLPEDVIEKYATIGLSIATTAYRHITDVDMQVCLAIYTFATYAADDDVIPVTVLREFVPRFYGRLAQLHPVLELLVENLTQMMPKHYATYNANAIVAASMEYFNAEMFERDGSAAGMEISRTSVFFVDYMRWKSGIGEAFAAQIWPKDMCPDTKDYIQAIP